MSIALRNRAERLTEYLNDLVMFTGVDTRKKTRIAILRNFQHLRRGTLDEMLEILKDAKQHPMALNNSSVTIVLDSITQKVKQL